MGWDPEAQQFQNLTPEKAATYTRGPVFYEGEEVVLKGLTFIVVDIAPGQIKLKPKRTPSAAKELEQAKAELAKKIEDLEAK